MLKDGIKKYEEELVSANVEKKSRKISLSQAATNVEPVVNKS